MSYSIGEFSRITNISIYTLRYYEKENLIIPERDKGGRRTYSEKDIAWIDFIKKLKQTNMPIKEIKKYAEYRILGDSTLKERMNLLIEHKERIEAEIAVWNQNLENIDKKIKHYENEIEKL